MGDGAPINESTLTIINWGKYRLRTLGLHQIATADNSNNWVVPALMEVSIPLIQNQVIDHTGTYRIVQRTVNGQTGLVIEEYIPEPEPEEEVLQNNNNTRAMIIDEDENNEENNNNGQMVLRGQNNVRGGDDPTPDPAGEAIEGTFEINITPTISKINIKSISTTDSSSGTKIQLSSLTRSNSSQTITVNPSSAFFRIHINSDNRYFIYYSRTDRSNTMSISVGTGDYYYYINNTYYSIFLFDENDEMILSLPDNIGTDSSESSITLSNTKFNLIFD